jgi:hypothetical protein
LLFEFSLLVLPSLVEVEQGQAAVEEPEEGLDEQLASGHHLGLLLRQGLIIVVVILIPLIFVLIILVFVFLLLLLLRLLLLSFFLGLGFLCRKLAQLGHGV